MITSITSGAQNKTCWMDKQTVIKQMFSIHGEREREKSLCYLKNYEIINKNINEFFCSMNDRPTCQNVIYWFSRQTYRRTFEIYSSFATKNIYPGANCVLQTLEISRFQIEKKEKKYTLHFKTIFQKSLYIFELGCIK